MKELRIGLVGTGGMGTVHLSNYAHIEGCKVVALCDKAPQAAEKATEMGLPLYDDINEMLNREELDVVDVCTPTFLHPEHVMAALEHSKHVICEKPLALTATQATAMMELAEQKGVTLFVGQVLQYAVETEILRELVRTGEYGRVLDASFLRLSACPRWVKNGWLFDKERSGHLPFDLHIHDLDLIVSLFGPPESFSYTDCGREEQTYREHYRFSYGFKDMNVMAESAWFNADYPFTATWRVYFDKAVVENGPQGLVAYQFDHEPRVFDTTEKLKIPTGINLPPTGMFYRELSDFLSQVRGGVVGCARRTEILSVIGILEKIVGG